MRSEAAWSSLSRGKTASPSQDVDRNGLQPKTEDTSAVALRDIRKAFISRNGQIVEAVANVSLDVRQGEIIAIVGPSGCGKSTLLRILGDLDDEFSGEIVWNQDGANRSNSRLRSATVFQSDSTLPWMTVYQNLQLGLSSLKLDGSTLQGRIDRCLSLVGLSEFRSAYPHELSGGMRQRVAIARALAAEPEVLLMDEPLAALDAQTRLVMQQELARIWSEISSTVFYVTHDIGEALSLADRIVVMTARPGRIKQIITVPFANTSDVMTLRALPEFGELEVHLWRLLADEVGGTLRKGRLSND